MRAWETSVRTLVSSLKASGEFNTAVSGYYSLIECIGARGYGKGLRSSTDTRYAADHRA
ncbi:hypothetical protein M378DRAFT_164839, partial [Amanita muscaria Koide BX008]